MTDTIITALITGGLTLLGVLVSNSKTQAVMETKVEELTREVLEHNNFAKRVTILEEQMGHVCDDIRELQGLHKRE